MGIHWFKHDISAFGDSSIAMLVARHGFDGYGHYWLLVESCHEHGPIWDLSDDDVRDAVAARHGWTDDELCGFVDDCCKFGLFDAGRWRSRKLTNSRICAQVEAYESQVEKCRNASRARWER
jgi:hypothetical protein